MESTTEISESQPAPRKRSKPIGEDYANEPPDPANIEWANRLQEAYENDKIKRQHLQSAKIKNHRIATVKVAILIVCKTAIVAMLFIAIGDMQYGYYQALRVVVTLLAAFIAYINHGHGNKSMVTYFVIVALIFNPFLPIKLGKPSWGELDFMVGIITLFTILHDWVEFREKNRP